MTDLGTYVWSGAGLVSDLHAWVSNTVPNHGWLLKGNETTTSTVKKFYSREGFTPPVLTVDYTPPAVDVPFAQADHTVVVAPPWPIPTSGIVNLSYTLPRATNVSITILDIKGRVVRRLVSPSPQPAGVHEAVWDGRTDSGRSAPSGLYLASLVAGDTIHHRRIPLVR